MAALISPAKAADAIQPRAEDRQVIRRISTLLGENHLSRHALDDEISERGLKQFLQAIDPMKMYLLASDVAEFGKESKNLDDMIRKGDQTFAYRVFNRFLERVDQHLKMIDELIDSQLDFTQDEDLVTDTASLEYAKDAAESRDRWRKRVKLDFLILKGDKKTGAEAQQRLHRRYHSFGKRMHQTSSDEILEMFLSSVTSSYDPHTSFMSKSSLENFRIVFSLSLEGIGAALKMEDGYTVVSNIIPGGAADKQGELKRDDRIVSVGQAAGDMVDVVDMKLNDIVEMIRGQAGTVVRLGVMPAGATETKVFTITRAKIALEDSAARQEVIETGKKQDGSPYRVGYIDLPSFYMDMEGARRNKEHYRSTTADLRTILEAFNKQRVDAVVIDLRRNGGGSLTEAISTTGLFIDEGPVVQVKDPAGGVQHFDDLERGMAWGGPLVVLTSKLSASASEILAGAIQDYRRGIIVGDKATHGKGTVQSLMELGQHFFPMIEDPPNYGALKITTQQFYRPNGDSTQKRGVLADVILPSITTHMDIGEADLDYALEFDKVPGARYRPYNMVQPDLLAALRKNSTDRIAASEDFGKLAKNVERYQEQKAKKRLSLNEDRFFSARADLDADKEEEKQLQDPIEDGRKGPLFARTNYYNQEVLNITVDYLRILEQNKVARAK